MKYLIACLLTLSVVGMASAQCGGYSTGYFAPAAYYGHGSTYCDLYDGYYHWHAAGWTGGRWFPAGNYRWYNGAWYLQDYGVCYGYDSPSYYRTVVHEVPVQQVVVQTPTPIVPVQSVAVQPVQQIPVQAVPNVLGAAYAPTLTYPQQQTGADALVALLRQALQTQPGQYATPQYALPQAQATPQLTAEEVARIRAILQGQSKD